MLLVTKNFLKAVLKLFRESFSIVDLMWKIWFMVCRLKTVLDLKKQHFCFFPVINLMRKN